MEDQCRLRIFGTAHDLRGERQAICRNRVGPQHRGQKQTRQHPGTQGAAQRDRALCLWLMRPGVFGGVVWDLLGCDGLFFRCYLGGGAVSRWPEIWNRVVTANKLAGKYRTGLNSVTFEPEDVCFHGEFRGISRRRAHARKTMRMTRGGHGRTIVSRMLLRCDHRSWSSQLWPG